MAGKKVLAVVLLVVISSVLFFPGCSKSKEEKPLVRILGPTKGTAEETEAWAKVMRDFEAETGIRVEARWQGNWPDLPQNLSAAKMAKEQVDLIVAGAGTLRSSLVRSGAIMNITELMKDLVDRFNEGMLDAFIIDGKLWGFPYADASASVFYYNKTLFDELGIKPPKNYQEFLKISKIIKEKKGIQPVFFQGKVNLAWQMLLFVTYVQTSGNTSVAKVEEFLSGKRRFSTEIEKEAFLLVKKLFDDGIFTLDSLDTDSEGMRAVFSQQKAAMFYGGTWEYGAVKDVVKDFEIGVFEFPLMVNTPGVKPGHGFGVGDYGIAIPSFAKEENLENTMRFVEYLLRPEVVNTILSINDPMVQVIKGMQVADTPIVQTLNNEVLKNSVLFLDWIWPAEVNDAFCRCIPAVVSGNMTPGEAVKIVEESLKTIEEEKDYKFDWWTSWTEEDWAKVTPKRVPDIKRYMK